MNVSKIAPHAETIDAWFATRSLEEPSRMQQQRRHATGSRLPMLINRTQILSTRLLHGPITPPTTRKERKPTANLLDDAHKLVIVCCPSSGSTLSDCLLPSDEPTNWTAYRCNLCSAPQCILSTRGMMIVIWIDGLLPRRRIMWMNECQCTEEQQCKLHLPLGYQFIAPQKWHWMSGMAFPSRIPSLPHGRSQCDRNNRVMMIMIGFRRLLPWFLSPSHSVHSVIPSLYFVLLGNVCFIVISSLNCNGIVVSATYYLLPRILLSSAIHSSSFISFHCLWSQKSN